MIIHLLKRLFPFSLNLVIIACAGCRVQDISSIPSAKIESTVLHATPSPSPLPSLSPSTTQPPSDEPLNNLPIRPTPTPLPKPHVIKVKNWKMVIEQSPVLCKDCPEGITVVNAPLGLEIAGVQIYATGERGSQTYLMSDLIYSDRVDCALTAEKTYCGFLSGQVYEGVVKFTARHISGGPQTLEYYITFQSWEDYNTPVPSVTQFPYPPPAGHDAYP